MIMIPLRSPICTISYHALNHTATRATRMSEEGLYTTAAVTATMIEWEAFNHSWMQSVCQLRTNGTDEINPVS